MALHARARADSEPAAERVAEAAPPRPRSRHNRSPDGRNLTSSPGRSAACREDLVELKHQRGEIVLEVVKDKRWAVAVRYRVFVVMDPAFGERLIPVAQGAHVWAIRSPENERAQRIFLSNQPPEWTWSERGDSGLTIFEAQAHFVDLLDSVVLHHGEYSHDPPVDEIEVIGGTLDEEVRAAFVEQGFPELVARRDGFLASRRMA